ncbi:uncharacterized protein LOC142331278 isoform X2 [Lycorma delicatula]|uniref:uncharacterized protein LOC142331278 isoform X2 n=1 Tax=Lycorma delicatula TaxID=130591 RepID=UPI003F5161FA
MNKGEEHWVQLRIGSVDTDFTDTLNKPQHLVGESSTDSSGNYNRLLPECLTKKAKLEERKESKTKAEEPVDISLNEEDSKQNNISLRSGTRCDDITNNDRFSFNKLAIRRSAMLKEPVINDDNNSNSALEQMEADNMTMISQMLQPPMLTDQLPADDFVEHMTCRTVRIGSYKVFPSDQVILTSQYVGISVPSIEDRSKSIKVRIPYSQIVKVLANYGRGLPVFFIYTTPLMGSKIRDVLNMISEDGFYYDPASKASECTKKNTNAYGNAYSITNVSKLGFY